MMKIVMWKRFSYAFALTVFATIAAYAGPAVRTISMRDECDPASFDAAVGPGTCVGDGDVTFAEFLGALADGGHEKWRFNSSNTEADRAVNAHNRGGEAHTFTPVAHFGGGFVEALNMGQEPLTECAARDDDGNVIPTASALATLVPPGGDSRTIPLSKGTHRFQCRIHPWMQSTVRVR
jgi:hypothetical protein